MQVTKAFRNDNTKNKLLLSYIRPHKEVGSKTVSRWLKQSLAAAGVDVSVFQGHSVRAASSSKAKLCGVPRDNILKMGGWSNERTFATHYDKPILDVTIGNITTPVTL